MHRRNALSTILKKTFFLTIIRNNGQAGSSIHESLFIRLPFLAKEQLDGGGGAVAKLIIDNGQLIFFHCPLSIFHEQYACGGRHLVIDNW